MQVFYCTDVECKYFIAQIEWGYWKDTTTLDQAYETKLPPK
ncbi:hypothetical protein [Desulfobacter hydrogenophilus]|nr:hypothetical protein [Desulfobacter hydrogenophilus]